MVMFLVAALAAPNAEDFRKVFADLDATLPGCAGAVYTGGELTWAEGVGRTEVGGAPLGSDTAFRIASTSKQFTAATVLLLADEGLVDLDAPVSTYIPELMGPPVTLRQLMHHSGGLRDYLMLMALSRIDEPYGMEAVLTVLSRQRGLDFEPDADWSYSNSGYLLLGEVAARVTDSSLREAASARIFEPLGMTNTLFVDDTTMQLPNRAYGHEWVKSGKAKNVDTTSNLVGDGGVYTTLNDVSHWVEHLRSDTLGIRDAQLARHTLSTGRTLAYAAGIELGTHRGQPVYKHSGSYAGFEAQIQYYPDQDVATAVFCNVEDESPGRRANGLGALFLPVDASDEPSGAAVVAFDSAAAAELVGDYWFPGGLQLSFGMGEDVLLMQAQGQSAPLGTVSARRYTFAQSDLAFRFFDVVDGEAQSVELTQRGQELLGRRIRTFAELDGVALEHHWWSDELQLKAKTQLKKGQLVMKSPLGKLVFDRVDDNRWASPSGFEVHFPDGLAGDLVFDSARAKGMVFERRP
jgi:CubicO group peptidase (beta-lactamase class C family)